MAQEMDRFSSVVYLHRCLLRICLLNIPFLFRKSTLTIYNVFVWLAIDLWLYPRMPMMLRYHAYTKSIAKMGWDRQYSGHNYYELSLNIQVFFKNSINDFNGNQKNVPCGLNLSTGSMKCFSNILFWLTYFISWWIIFLNTNHKFR